MGDISAAKWLDLLLDRLDSDEVLFKEKMEHVMTCIDDCIQIVDEVNTYFQNVGLFYTNKIYIY